jgi:hypothetical protein
MKQENAIFLLTLTEQDSMESKIPEWFGSTILKNIVLVTYALVILLFGPRGGNSWLSRFLDNIRSTPELLIPLHIALACGTKFGERLPMVLDQTIIWGIETLLIGLIFEGQVFPIAFSCFMERFIHKSRKNQNILKHGLILNTMSCFPVEFRLLLILDRGYAEIRLLIHLREEGIPFLCRVKLSVVA